MGAQGIAVIDFGAHPGLNEKSVVVTGQAAIVAGSMAEAFVMAEATADHTTGDHTYLPVFITLTTGDIVAGTGFTIFSRSEHRLQGTFNLKWVWN